MTDEPKKPAGERIEEAGEKMQRAGCAMTLVLTVPIVGFFVFGWFGLIVGLAIAAVAMGGIFKS